MLLATLLLLSVTTRFPLRAALAPGVNVIAIVQLEFDASVARQVVTSLKSVGLVPVKVMEPIFNVALPVLLSVKVCDALGVAVGVLINMKVLGLRPASGAVLRARE